MNHTRSLAARQPGSVLLETARPAPGEPARSFLFTAPLEWLEARRLADLPGLFQRLEQARVAGLWTAGFLSYECGYHWEPTAAPGFTPASNPGTLPLAAFGIYREPAAVTPETAPQTRGLADARLAISRSEFAAKVARIHRWIERGDTYQANLTDELLATFAGDPAELFAHMMAQQPVPFGALLRVGDACILSASPELFFHQRGRHITVRPMKGTARRGRDDAEDQHFARALAADPKNRAENLMIVDLLRSDLGRVAETGSVRVRKLFSIETLPSLLQMTSDITATLRPEIDAYALFAALFPSGSIVGAPKVRTMQILRALEQRDRGVYTGAIGYFSPGGEAVFSVAIRTAVVGAGQARMGVGAGITYDSDAADEYAECLLKADFIQAPLALIETMRWEHGRCDLLVRHIDRLAASARELGFLFDRARLAEAIQLQGAALPGAGVWRLRLELSRQGALTFSPPQPVLPDTTPMQAMLWPEPVDAHDPLLRHKTTRRALYDRAAAEAQRLGFVDALFVNEHGAVTEGAIHTIFARHGEHWRTPPLTAGVLPGVYRAHLLHTLEGVREAELTVHDLETADALWLTNAVRGVRLVTLARAPVQPSQGELAAPEPHAIVRS